MKQNYLVDISKVALILPISGMWKISVKNLGPVLCRKFMAIRYSDRQWPQDSLMKLCNWDLMGGACEERCLGWSTGATKAKNNFGYISALDNSCHKGCLSCSKKIQRQRFNSEICHLLYVSLLLEHFTTLNHKLPWMSGQFSHCQVV